jgi:uncharacterized protein YyaL (SSP411 family)
MRRELNRLSKESSPYLQAHAKNPVDWYPWSEEAFQRAKDEDKLIFLSIGYSSCHWCHVMEIESFENENIASLLNENFISIKVDKEERPDIDRHFQNIFVQMNGRVGGWPLSIFMTHQKIPIFSATYIPPEDNYGMVGFRKLTKSISKKYHTQKETLLQKGQIILNSIAPKREIKATKVTEDLVKIVSSQIKSTYDSKNGGFGEAPKFPRVSALMLSLGLYRLNQDEELLKIVKDSIDKMSIGGLYDLVDGGYCRYSVDKDWLVPHFEKMLYDNALMIELLAEVYSRTKIKRYLRLAKSSAEFLLSKMSEDGLFFSSSDADSDGVEGGYFIYDYDEVIVAFTKAGLESPEHIAKKLNITKEGNFEGANIVRLSSWDDYENLQEALDVLKDIRKSRVHPKIDNKVLTSWNAMAIKSLLKLSKFEPKYQKIALDALEKLHNFMGRGSKVYHSRVIGKESSVDGFLEDFAYLGVAMVEAYNITLKSHYLSFAKDLTNEAIKRFYRGGKWSIGDGEFRDFVDDRDISYPSEVGVMLDLILSMSNLEDIIYKKFAYKTIQAHSYDLMRQPLARAYLSLMTIRYLKDDKIES